MNPEMAVKWSDREYGNQKLAERMNIGTLSVSIVILRSFPIFKKMHRYLSFDILRSLAVFQSFVLENCILLKKEIAKKKVFGTRSFLWHLLDGARPVIG